MDLLASLSLPITNPTWIFFVVLLIILAAPLLFERLKVPQIVGMIVAGLLIGPHGLNILGSDSSFELFGRVGLYYIMFMAGLSMDSSALKMRRGVLTFGVLSWLLPFVTGFVVALVGLGLGAGSSLLVACVLSSHTLVSYPMVARYGLTKSEGAKLSVVATLLSLILALFVLAGLAAHYDEGASAAALWWLPVRITVYLTVLLLVYPRVIRWFFRTFSDDVLQYIFVLMLVFLSAAVSEAMGLEGVLGAFLAGLIFNRYIPETVPLMRHIDFVGNALFIPYFLISVGMLINFSKVFTSGRAVELVVVIAVMAIATKWLAVTVSASLLHLGKTTSKLMTGLTSGHAAGALAMLMVGRELETEPGVPLVDDALLGAVVMLILVSCVFSAMVTTSAARKLMLETLGDEEKKGEEDKILVALANPGTTQNLVKLALMLRPHRSTAPLVGVRLVVDAKDNERERESAHLLVKEAAQIAAAAGVNMKKVVRSGVNIVTALIYTMKDFDASEIVIGWSRNNGRLYGNVTEGLLSRGSRRGTIANINRAINTLRMIHVIVPPNAEKEIGFRRWLMHTARLARQMDCRIVYYASESAYKLIEDICQHHYKTIRMEWQPMPDLLAITDWQQRIHPDHLLVIISARKGSLSLSPQLLKFQQQLPEMLPETSKMLIFPDQYGIEDHLTAFKFGIK